MEKKIKKNKQNHHLMKVRHNLKFPTQTKVDRILQNNQIPKRFPIQVMLRRAQMKTK